MSKIFPLICVAALLSSCASIMSGSGQVVTVVTPDADGASCSLTDAKARVWHIEKSPVTALVRRGDGPISVICSKEGYTNGTGLLGEGIAGASFANLLFLPGYFIDGMTGSLQKYKSSINIEMEKLPERKPWESPLK